MLSKKITGQYPQLSKVSDTNILIFYSCTLVFMIKIKTADIDDKTCFVRPDHIFSSKGNRENNNELRYGI